MAFYVIIPKVRELFQKLYRIFLVENKHTSCQGHNKKLPLFLEACWSAPPKTQLIKVLIVVLMDFYV